MEDDLLRSWYEQIVGVIAYTIYFPDFPLLLTPARLNDTHWTLENMWWSGYISG